jgi:hypothetical protein
MTRERSTESRGRVSRSRVDGRGILRIGRDDILRVR